MWTNLGLSIFKRLSATCRQGLIAFFHSSTLSPCGNDGAVAHCHLCRLIQKDDHKISLSDNCHVTDVPDDGNIVQLDKINSLLFKFVGFSVRFNDLVVSNQQNYSNTYYIYERTNIYSTGTITNRLNRLSQSPDASFLTQPSQRALTRVYEPCSWRN